MDTFGEVSCDSDDVRATQPSINWLGSDDVRATHPGMTWPQDDAPRDDEDDDVTQPQPMARGELNRLVDTFLLEEDADETPNTDVVFSRLDHVSADDSPITLPTVAAISQAQLAAASSTASPKTTPLTSRPLVWLAISAPLFIIIGWILGQWVSP